MKKSNTLHIILEVIAFLSFIFIGVTVLTFLNYPDVDIHNKSFIGSIVLAIGTTELVQFLSLNYLGRRRNILNAIAAGSEMILGILFMALRVELDTICIIWAIVAIVVQIVKIVDAGMNIMRQPLINTVTVILCIVEFIYCIFLLVNKASSLIPFFTFIGIALLVKAVVLIVEFFIHRYQK